MPCFARTNFSTPGRELRALKIPRWEKEIAEGGATKEERVKKEKRGRLEEMELEVELVEVFSCL